MIMFGTVVTVLWGGLHFYVGQRLIAGSGLSKPWFYAAWGMVALHASLTPVAFMSRRGWIENDLAAALQWVTYTGMGFFVLLLLMVVARDVVMLVESYTRSFHGGLPDPTRRALLGGGVNLGMIAGAGMGASIGFIQATRAPRVDEVTIDVEGLAEDLDGVRIVQISDTHVGPTIRRPFAELVVSMVNELGADLVAVTGDLIDGYVPDLESEVAPFADLRARHGVFYVTGNHEYYWDAPGWLEHAAHLGMVPLANEHRLVEIGAGRLLVGGVTDYSAERMMPSHASDPAQAIAGAPEHDFSVLLAHQPRSCYAAADAGWKLQLSGHTHGGQFWPWNLLVGLAHPFSAGLGRFRDKMWVYVNRGTGYWGPPMRLGIPSEITVLTLRRT